MHAALCAFLDLSHFLHRKCPNRTILGKIQTHTYTGRATRKHAPPIPASWVRMCRKQAAYARPCAIYNGAAATCMTRENQTTHHAPFGPSSFHPTPLPRCTLLASHRRHRRCCWLRAATAALLLEQIWLAASRDGQSHADVLQTDSKYIRQDTHTPARRL